MDTETQEKIHRIWDELSDFETGQSDQAATHLMESLCNLADAWNATWGGATRMDGNFQDDPLQGWRVSAMKLLQPIAPHPNEGPFKEILKLWDRREIDPSFLLPMRGVGTFRTYSFRRELPPDWFESPFYKAYYGLVGTCDSVFIGFPLNQDAESHFGFYSSKVFSDEEIALLTYAVRGIKWFHRQLMLSHGLLMASSPLTPTERRVLRLLLTEASEKHIADQAGLAVSTTHQHVIAIFRKFGVRSRAGLMSLWLNRGG
ncbi:response regulator transcription factor [Methylococcus sp. Mc7]|uniref:response regulator transcription factor n=1 Tax=Methylococcus sp. Mc7 TaxID=2860258 RepID=UPI001C53304A|nr:helix-turn-helix transcriptional regulator [Methylococcus sp. Mc7]QXP83058.1 helix-turn-helix transcriptional regulator [Methylococcus sp. Mc7]